MNLKLTLLAASIILSNSTYADELEDVERITVSSGFRSLNIQNLPASVSVIPEVLIKDRQAQHLEQILNVAANVNFASGASRGRFIQIRGIGERSQFSEPLNPSVGLLVDDFDFSGIAAVGTLFDVEQVEVMRGPQATEFGASAMAGVISIKTAEADEDQETKLSATLADHGTWSLGAATGAAIADNLFYRVAIQQFQSNGFVENTFLKRDDTDNLDELTARFKLKYLPSDTLTIDMNYQYFDIDNGYDAFSLDNDGKTLSDEPGFDRQETHAFGVKARQDNDWGQLMVIVNHTTSDLAYGYDEDWTFDGFHPNGYSSFDQYNRDVDTTTLDLRLLSGLESNLFEGKTQWVLGLYAKTSDQNQLRQYTFANADFTSNYEPKNFALYGQTDTQLNEKFNLSVGLRLDKFLLDYSDSNNFVSSSDETMLGGKVVLDYSLDSANIYASVSRGYKTAGFNPDERVSDENRIYDPEFNWNYEFGIKGNLEDVGASVRMAVFYMEREDTQVSDFDTLLRDDGSTDFIDVIGNADTGTNWGVEIESAWQLNDAWSVAANFGFLDATFSEYELADGSFVEKQEQAQAPKHTLNIASQFYFNDHLSWRLEMDAKDSFRFSDGHDERSPSYQLVNTSLTYALEAFKFTLWAKNLFDEVYYVRGFGGFSNDPRDGYSEPEPYFQLGDDRQVGISIDYQY
jgi:outer membrane receptor protein involved in Fe transport